MEQGSRVAGGELLLFVDADVHYEPAALRAAVAHIGREPGIAMLALLPHWRERRFGHVVNVSSAGVQARSPKYSAYLPTKAALAFYIGGMGARSRNFHMELMSRMGFEAEAHKIQELFFEGRRDEADLKNFSR